MKKIISLTLSLIMLMTSAFCTNSLALAKDTAFDDGIVASFDETSGTLYLMGERDAAVADKFAYSRDWSSVDGLASTDDVIVIDISGNITRIGAGALSDFTSAKMVIIRSIYCSIGDTTAIPEGAEICAFSGSEVETFAEENGYAFRRLFNVTYKYSLTGKQDKTLAFPEGTSGKEIVKDETIYKNISNTQHTEFYFPTSIKIDATEGLSGNVTLTEFSRTRQCVFGTDETIVPPVCIYEGYKTHSCIYCGNEVKIDGSEIPAEATSHAFELTDEVAPSCTSEGENTFTCTACGETKTEKTDKLSHIYELTNEVAPTCTSDGENTFTCIACDDTKTEKIKKIPHTFELELTKATLDENGKLASVCTACGFESSCKMISSPASFELRQSVFTYDGKVHKPRVTVKDAQGNVISSDNYSLKYSKGRKCVGTYKVTVTFKGDYEGTKDLYFTINPKGTSISKLTAGKKSFTVKWKKQSRQTRGYQLQYSTSRSFTSKKTVTIKKNSITSRKISQLKKKKYYVRVRTYMVADGKKYYSPWSETKSVKINK